MTKKRGLGRGLSALIPDGNIEEINSEDRIEYLDINKLEPNKDQPRTFIDNSSIDELSKSIKEHGVIQPIIVRKKKNGYQIIAGERRWRATRLAGLDKIPCIIKKVEDIKSAEMALIENIQREDLNPIEEAIAYDNISKKYNLTQDDLSKVVGKSRSYVTNILRLLKLENEIINKITEGLLSGGHGKAILMLKDSSLQNEIASEIEKKGLSVRETENLVKKINESDNKIADKVIKYKEPNIQALEEDLMKLLGTKVIVNTKKKKGKIEIEFYNEEDLKRIIDIITK
ncbi:ParB/RepB/Spo0J family partition protein [Abyssisolibacter fermentans]|uniref:ParB/RepB/Spo0J family partition protein n=1 Tax=Abyssisolibacter fermentans TaxID=1766203 RepID=UPI0008341D2C